MSTLPYQREKTDEYAGLHSWLYVGTSPLCVVELTLLVVWVTFLLLVVDRPIHPMSWWEDWDLERRFRGDGWYDESWHPH